MRRVGAAEVASILGSLVILVGSFTVAYSLGDPYWVRRGGALLVLYSLVFAFRAHELDEVKESLEQGAAVSPIPESAPPAIKLSREIDEDVRQYQRTLVTLTVSRVFRVHLIMAALGEVLHGFGDLIYIALLGPVPAH